MEYGALSYDVDLPVLVDDEGNEEVMEDENVISTKSVEDNYTVAL